MRDRQITSPSTPTAKLEVADGFSYVGRIAYSLEGPFEGERFVFADSKDKPFDA